MPRLAFTDYDGFAEAVRDVSVRMRMCSRQVGRWTLQYEAFGPVVVQHGFEGGGSIAEGINASDAWSFYLQSRPGFVNGQSVNEDQVFAAPPGREFCLACKPSHDWLAVHIPTRLLFPSTPDLEFATRAGALLLKPPPQVTQRFRWLLHRVLEASESQPRLLDSPPAVDACAGDLLSAAQQLLASSGHGAIRHFDRWQGITKSAMELTMATPAHSHSIAALAEQAGVPERTFRTAFHRCYGLSPQAYLRIQRLHEARRLLRDSCPERTTVIQIAFGLGFWDLGRFAGRYRTLFGEAPSQTLRNHAVIRRRRRTPDRGGRP